MQKPRDTRFYATEEDLQPEDFEVEITASPVQKVMGFLFGFDRVNTLWRKLSVDSNGRLRTTGGVASISNFLPVQIGLTFTEVQIAPARDSRQYLIVDNLGVQTVLLGLRSGDTTGVNAIELPNDYYVIMDGYTGPLFASLITGAQNVLVMDV